MSNTNASLKIPVLADLTQMRAEMAKVEAILGTTASAMKTASNAFDGAKVVAAANAALLAVQNLGGVAKLTETEQAKLNATLTLGIEKYKALGRDAPAAMLAMADATKQASEATGGWLPLLHEMGTSWVARIAEGMLLRDAVHAVIDKVKEMIVFLPELVLQGSKVAGIEKNFDRLTEAAGLTASTLMGTLRTATHNTITDFDLMKRVNQDLAAGMNLSNAQFGTLAKGAFALAKATGTDVKEALDTMSDAMLTGRTRSLALLTGKISQTAAEEAYAKSLLSSADHLTDEGKLEASRVAILNAVGAATARLGDQTDGLGTVVKQASVWWENFQEDLGKTIAASPVLKAEVLGIRDALIEAFGGSQEALIKNVSARIIDASVAVLDMARASATTVGVLRTEWYAAEKVFGDVAQIIDGVRLAFLLTKQTMSLGLLPGTVNLSEWKILDDQIADLEVKMKQRGDSLQDLDRKQASVGASTEKYTKILNDLQARVEAAKQSTAAYVGPLEAEAGAHEHAGNAAGRHAGMLQASKEEISKAKAEAEKFAAAMAELNAVGAGWAGTLDTIDGNVVEAIKYYLAAGVAQDKLVTAYHLTAAQVKAVDSALKDHTEALKIADAIAKLFTAEGDKNWKAWQASVAKSLDETNKKVVEVFHGFVAAQKTYNEAVAKDTLDSSDFQRYQLQQQLEDAKVKLRELGASYQATYDLIAKTVEIKLSEIADASANWWKGGVEHEMMPPGLSKSVSSVTTEVQRLQSAFTALGQTVGGTFGAMLTGASQIAGLFSAANQAQANYNANPTEQNKKALDQAKSNRTWGTVGIAAGLVAQTINTGAGAPTKNLVASGALQGAAAGSAFGPWGTAIGAGAGALVGWWQSGAEWRKAFSDISRDFGGLHVPEDFAKTIEQIESDTGLKRAQAITSQLDQLIKFAGGLNPGNLEMFAGKLHDAFSYIEQGSMSVAQVSQVLDKTFADFAAAGTDAYGRINDTIREMIDLDQRFGTQSKAITEWMQGQATAMATGLGDLLSQPLIASADAVGKAVADAQAAVDKQKDAIDAAIKGSSEWKTATDELAKAQDVLTAALSTQHGESERNKQSLDDLGFAAVTAFNAAIASGQTFAQALQGISPQLSTIEKAYKDLGLAIDDAAIKGLTLENTILNGPGGVGKAIGGLQAIVTAGTNLGKGVETPEAFAAQQRQLASLYTQTQASTAAAGGTTINALLPFQQTLHELQDWANKNKIDLDESTKEKIRQSQELGIWNDDFKTDAEKTRQSIADLIASNDTLAAALGAAARSPWAQGGTPSSGFLPGDDPTGGLIHPPIPIQMASGGFGFASGPMVFSTKGNEEYAFSGEGKRFSRGDDQGQPQTQTIVYSPTYNFSAFKPDNLAEIVEHEVAPQLLGLFEDRVRDYQERLAAVAAQRRRT